MTNLERTVSRIQATNRAHFAYHNRGEDTMKRVEWREVLIARMKIERITEFTPAEIERVFKDCVASARCVTMANLLIADGDIKMCDCIPTIWEDDGTTGPVLLCAP